MLNETEAKKFAALSVIPFGVAMLGLVVAGASLGIEATNLPVRLTEAHTVVEMVRTIVTSINPVVTFGALRLALQYGTESLTILGTGLASTVAGAIVLALRARN